MSTALPNSPALLDVTGQAMVTQLQAIVTAINNSGGGGGGSSTLAGLNDVTISNPSNGQVLTYNSTTSKWVNAAGGGGGSSTYLMPETYRDHIDTEDPEEYVSGILYEVGDYCTHNDVVYKCIYQISYNSDDGPHAWDSEEWTEVSNVFAELQNKPGEKVRLDIESGSNGVYGERFNEESYTYNHGSHAEGRGYASGDYAHAEGQSSASGMASHSEGSATAGGTCAHAEGYQTHTYANYSHAEGDHTETRGIAGHAEGYYTKASANYSHAGGYLSEAKGLKSFAHGEYASATNENEIAFGKYNKSANLRSDVAEYQTTGKSYVSGEKVKHDNDGIIYSFNGGYQPAPAGEWNSSKWTDTGERYETDPDKVTVFTIGNGTASNNRSNLFEITTDGNIKGNGVPCLRVAPPVTDGVYTLQVSVASGVPTYSWVATV